MQVCTFSPAGADRVCPADSLAQDVPIAHVAGGLHVEGVKLLLGHVRQVGVPAGDGGAGLPVVELVVPAAAAGEACGVAAGPWADGGSVARLQPGAG